MERSRRTALLAVAFALALVAAGCGEDDFPNEPRPPAAIELTAKIDDEKVVVSPTEVDGAPVGAGLANVTIANLSDEDAQLVFDGPSERTTDPILAGGVLNFKLDLEQGDYAVRTADSDAREAELTVGPPRPSAQNELLLP